MVHCLFEEVRFFEEGISPVCYSVRRAFLQAVRLAKSGPFICLNNSSQWPKTLPLPLFHQTVVAIVPKGNTKIRYKNTNTKYRNRNTKYRNTNKKYRNTRTKFICLNNSSQWPKTLPLPLFHQTVAAIKQKKNTTTAQILIL